MKTSYVKFLRIVVAIGYYGAIVGLVVLIIGATLSYYKAQRSVHFTIEMPLQLKSASFSTADWSGTINSGKRSLLTIDSPKLASNWKHSGLYVLVSMAVALSISIVILMMSQLKRIVATLGTPDVFSTANVVRIRILGGLLIATQLVQPLIWLLVRADVLAILNQQHIQYSNEQISFGDSNLLLAGLLVIGLAEVFRSGYQLKQDQELTI